MAAGILTVQGDGDYAGVVSWYRPAKTASKIRPDLDRIQAEGIPIDVIYEQGLEVLGLT